MSIVTFALGRTI